MINAHVNCIHFSQSYSSSKVAVFSLLTMDVDLCLNMSEDLNQIYCGRSLDMNFSKEYGKYRNQVNWGLAKNLLYNNSLYD
jgi:hypothetical protein